MLDLSVLLGLTPALPEGKRGNKAEKTAVDKSIKGDFRITKGGAIIFSEAFRNKLRDENLFIDVIDGTEAKWENDAKPNFMFVTLVSNKLPKASIQTSWTEETKEETKFVVAFVKKWFKQMAHKIYGVNWETTPNVDFTILQDNGLEFKMFYTPRTSKTGEPDYVKRENVTVFPLVPTSMLEPKVDAVQQEIPFEETTIVEEVTETL